MRFAIYTFAIVSLLFAQGQEDVAEEIQSGPDPSQIFGRMETLWSDLHDYTCVLHSYIEFEEETDDRTYEYRYMKPGWVYMKIVAGKDKGARVRYDPVENKVSGAKGGIISFIKKSFDIDDPTVRSVRGHRVNESNWGLFVERAKGYFEAGSVSFTGTDTLTEGETFVLEFAAEDPRDEIGVARETWWISAQDTLPVQFEEYDVDGEFIRRINIRDLKFDQNLTEEDFGI